MTLKFKKAKRGNKIVEVVQLEENLLTDNFYKKIFIFCNIKLYSVRFMYDEVNNIKRQNMFLLIKNRFKEWLNIGDWLIKDKDNNFYGCNNDTFKILYKVVENE